MPLYPKQRRHCHQLGNASHTKAEERRAAALLDEGNKFIARDEEGCLSNSIDSLCGRSAASLEQGSISSAVETRTAVLDMDVYGQGRGGKKKSTAAKGCLSNSIDSLCGRSAASLEQGSISSAVETRTAVLDMDVYGQGRGGKKKSTAAKVRNEGRACAGLEDSDAATRATEGIYSAFMETRKDELTDKKWGELHKNMQHALTVHSSIPHTPAKEDTGLIIGTILNFHVDNQLDIAALYGMFIGDILYEKNWVDTQIGGWTGRVQFRNAIVANTAFSRRDIVTNAGRKVFSRPLSGEPFDHTKGASMFVKVGNVPAVFFRRADLLRLVVSFLSPHEYSFEGGDLILEFRVKQYAIEAAYALDRCNLMGSILSTSTIRF